MRARLRRLPSPVAQRGRATGRGRRRRGDGSGDGGDGGWPGREPSDGGQCKRGSARALDAAGSCRAR
eukprot:3517049-Pyramimonas_sp.AAC.1